MQPTPVNLTKYPGPAIMLGDGASVQTSQFILLRREAGLMFRANITSY